MDLKSTLIQGTKYLKTRKELQYEAALDAEILLSHALKKSKEFLYSHPEMPINKNRKIRYHNLIKKRLVHEPIAYIIKSKEFYNTLLYINKNVLIPRPETENLLEELLHYKNKIQLAQQELTLADIGTGSGCLAVSLSLLFPQLTIYATDISQKALYVAKKNARKYNARIKFFHGDLLRPLLKRKIHILIANLPYLTKNFLSFKKNSELSYEPYISLHGGRDGLKFYKMLFIQIKSLNFSPYIIFCEIEPSQIKSLKKMVRAIVPQYSLEFKKDYQHYSRIAKFTLMNQKNIFQ